MGKYLLVEDGNFLVLSFSQIYVRRNGLALKQGERVKKELGQFHSHLINGWIWRTVKMLALKSFALLMQRVPCFRCKTAMGYICHNHIKAIYTEQVHFWYLPRVENNEEQNQATGQSSANSSESLSALNEDYKYDTFGLEHLYKSWPEASWRNNTPASGKAPFKNAHARF